MGYINDFRAKLRRLIEAGETNDAIQYAADTVLESYRNGAHGSAQAQKRDSEERTRGRSARAQAPAHNRRTTS